MADDAFWDLRLYVTGRSSKALRATANLERICEEHLRGHYKIEVIDLAENPSLARSEDIVATPALVRHLPEPRRMLMGDLSDTERVLTILMS